MANFSAELSSIIGRFSQANHWMIAASQVGSGGEVRRRSGVLRKIEESSSPLGCSPPALDSALLTPPQQRWT